jgi:dihydropyrimidine dehydrogenase (NAD+) subunit PreA
MNLHTSFLGKSFENPFILASAPPTANADRIRKGFEAGWGGAVIKTLDPEPFTNTANRFASKKIGRKIYAFSNFELLSETSPQKWFDDIYLLKKDFPEKVIIGSVMGTANDKSQWIALTKGCQDAGADFVELNFSCPHGLNETGRGSAIGQSATYSHMITRWVKQSADITIPIIPKLSAAVREICYIGEQTAKAGADGFTAINTFPSFMGFDLKTLQPLASVGGYSTSGGYSGMGLKPIALRCVSDLVKKPGLPVMGCGGISSGFDAAEFMLLGAPVVQVCTAVMLHGFGIIKKLKNELMEFMSWHQFREPGDFTGILNNHIRGYADLDATLNIKYKIDPERCTSCGACLTSCEDAAYQAIEKSNGSYRIITEKCHGCSLCFQVCPRQAIRMEPAM